VLTGLLTKNKSLILLDQLLNEKRRANFREEVQKAAKKLLTLKETISNQ
jgi:hypothetical protein